MATGRACKCLALKTIPRAGNRDHPGRKDHAVAASGARGGGGGARRGIWRLWWLEGNESLSAAALVADFDGVVTSQGFTGLAITLRHGQAAGLLPGPHQDPFDRMLIAQAMLENLVLVSNERLFYSYDIRTCW